MSDESKTAAVAASDAPASEDGTDAVAAFYGETTAAAYASTMDEEMKTYFALIGSELSDDEFDTAIQGLIDSAEKTKLATSVDCGATFLFWYNEAIFHVPH